MRQQLKRLENCAQRDDGRLCVMSPNPKTPIVMFGGMAVMVVTTVCGWEIGSMNNGNLSDMLVGGAIGALVGVPIWVWLGYMVYRKKNAPPNEITPDDTTT